MATRNSYDYPTSTELVDENRNVTVPWAQWIQRTQNIVRTLNTSGPTSQRPVDNLWIGQQYWDTTLGSMVWLQSYTGGVATWVAAGGGGGGGDFSGPAVSINNSVVTFNGTTGKLGQDSGVGIASLAPLASPAFTGTATAVNVTYTGLALTAASTTTSAGVRLPHGAAPTTPTNGDLWSTTAGFFGRVNGATVGPFGAYDGTTATGSLAKWSAAKLRGSTNPARFAVVGDSNVTGQGTGSGASNLTGAASTGFARQLANLAGYQIGSFFGEQNVTFVSVTLPTYDPRIALGSGWVPDSTVSGIFGGRFLTAPASSTGRLVFSPAGAFNRFRFWYPTTSSANTAVGVFVDGIQIDTVNQSPANSLTFKDYSVSSATHTIGFSCGATGTAYVQGVETYGGSNVPVMLQGGWCGALAADIASNGSPWNSLSGTATIAPDFLTLYCTINDTNSATAINAYCASIEAYVKAAAVTANGCICVGFPANITGVTSGYYNSIATALRNIATDYGWFYYDCRRNLGNSYTRATGLGLAYDTLHPNFTGATAVATGLYGFLAASGL